MVIPRGGRARTGAMAGVPAVLAVLAVVTVTLASPAAAHTDLARAVPGDGAVVAEPPSQVRFDFTGGVQDLFVSASVKGPDGKRMEDGAPRIEGNSLVQKIKPARTPGRYTVAMRVVAADGHPISKQVIYTFTPGATPRPGTAPPPPPGGPPGGDQGGEPASGGDAGQGSPDDGGGVPWLPIGLVVLAVVTAGGVLAWQERQRES